MNPKKTFESSPSQKTAVQIEEQLPNCRESTNLEICYSRCLPANEDDELQELEFKKDAFKPNRAVVLLLAKQN